MSKDKKVDQTTDDKAADAQAKIAQATANQSEDKAGKKQEEEDFKHATTMHVKVYSPFQVYFDDEAVSISAENDTGPFDILPQHHNFITLLNPCELDVKSGRGDKRIKISRGVMHVRKNKVTVFLDV